MQNEGENILCRLCLKPCELDFENIEAATIEMLRILRLELYLDQNGTSTVCKPCSENIKMCFDFKTVCIYTEDFINSCRNERNNVKFDLGEVYLKKNENKNLTVPKCHNICRLCMELAESSYCIPLNSKAKDAISAEAILRRYFSEIDLDSPENPHICASCNESLHRYFTFVKHCLDVKGGIKNCCKIEESNDKNQVKPDGKLWFGRKNVSNYKNGRSGIDIHKNCNENELYDEIELKLENIVQDESQEWQVKHEVNEREEIGNAIRDIDGNCHEFNIKHEEINIKTEEGDVDGFQNMLIPKNTAEVTVYSCEICKYKAKWKCSLKQHMLIHNNASKITMYCCELCTYKARLKGNLKNHMLIHKNTSEVTMYSCELCTYKSKHKRSLKQHMLIHKNTSEVTVYSCEICTYEAKRKDNLKKHMLIHKNTSEVTMYCCEICTYKTKHKSSLKQHRLIHKNTSEVTLYSCEVCTYKAKQKSSLKTHMLIHKNTSEVTMYSCEICTYKTKQKSNLKTHMLIHKNVSDVTIHSCEICTYKTKQKSNLKTHILIHKNTSEVTMYFCDICTYKAKQKSNLKTHMLIHKNTSEVTMYSCEICNYKAKHKSSLKRHMLIHSYVSV